MRREIRLWVLFRPQSRSVSINHSHLLPPAGTLKYWWPYLDHGSADPHSCTREDRATCIPKPQTWPSTSPWANIFSPLSHPSLPLSHPVLVFFLSKAQEMLVFFKVLCDVSCGLVWQTLSISSSISCWLRCIYVIPALHSDFVCSHRTLRGAVFSL